MLLKQVFTTLSDEKKACLVYHHVKYLLYVVSISQIDIVIHKSIGWITCRMNIKIFIKLNELK